MLKLKLQYFGHLMWRTNSLEKTLRVRKIESKRRRGQDDEIVGWHHRLTRLEFEKTLGDSEGQGSLACCSPWGCRVEHDLANEQQPTRLPCSQLQMPNASSDPHLCFWLTGYRLEVPTNPTLGWIRILTHFILTNDALICYFLCYLYYLEGTGFQECLKWVKVTQLCLILWDPMGEEKLFPSPRGMLNRLQIL